MIALAVIAVILLFLLTARVGAEMCYDSVGLRVWIIAGPVKIKAYPAKKSDKKKDMPKKEKPKKDKPKKDKQEMPDLKRFIIPGIKSMRRIFSGLRIKRLRVNLTLRGDDAAETAIRYGRVCALFGLADGITKRLRRQFLRPKFTAGADFGNGRTTLNCRLCLYIRIFNVLGASLPILAELLRYLRDKRREA